MAPHAIYNIHVYPIFYLRLILKMCFKKSKNDIKVVVGSIKVSSGGTAYSVSDIISHSEYDLVTCKNDISLIKTSSEIIFGKYVEKIQFYPKHVDAGIQAVLSGWGRMANFVKPDTLQFIDFLTISNTECADKNQGEGLVVKESNICTSTKINEASCSGDSCGPLVVDSVLVGIMSWGCLPCGLTEHPDVFTRVSSCVDWITDNTT